MVVPILLTEGFLAGDLSTERSGSKDSRRLALADRSEGSGQ